MVQGKYVFISYSSRDISVVNMVLKTFDEMNVRYWKAPEMIPAGSSYAQEIVSAIENCSMVLVFLSRNSQNSQWVEKEIDSAVNYNKKIIPLMIDDYPMNAVFRFYLNNVQMIAYKNSPRIAIQELKGHIKGLSTIGTGAEKKALFVRKKSNGKTVAPQEAAKPAQTPSSKPAVKAAPSSKTINQKPVVARPLSMPGSSSAQMPTLPPAHTPPKKRIHRMKPVDFLSKNRRPVVCQYCGGALTDNGNGVYPCLSCGIDNYDDFQEIRNYITTHGPVPVSVLAKNLGIPRDIINDFRDRQ